MSVKRKSRTNCMVDSLCWMKMKRRKSTFHHNINDAISFEDLAQLNDFPPYSNLVAGFISNIRRFDVPPRRFDIPPHKFDFTWFVCLYIEYVHEYVQGA